MSDATKPASTAKPGQRECCQEQTLLRDLALVNARVVREQGSASRAGQRVQPKRKPDLPRRESPAPAEVASNAAPDEDSSPR